MAATTEEVIEMLKTAYSMELETVINYLANSTGSDPKACHKARA